MAENIRKFDGPYPAKYHRKFFEELLKEPFFKNIKKRIQEAENCIMNEMCQQSTDKPLSFEEVDIYNDKLICLDEILKYFEYNTFEL